MLIPITFKNDDTASKKSRVGKITPANARLLNSFSLLKKVGIFEGYGSNCSAISTTITANSDNTFTITLNKGAFNIYGGVGVIEQGTTVIIPNTYSRGSFGIRVDLKNDAGQEVLFYTKSQDDALVQNDLQANEVSGVYEFELYKYTINGSVMTLTEGVNFKDRVVGHYENLVNMFGGMSDYVVTFIRDGNTWFRKWKSGWKEYGEMIDASKTVNGEITCSFKEAFENTDYSVSIQTIDKRNAPIGSSGDATYPVMWASIPLVSNQQKDYIKFNAQTFSGEFKYSVVVCGY